MNNQLALLGFEPHHPTLHQAERAFIQREKAAFVPDDDFVAGVAFRLAAIAPDAPFSSKVQELAAVRLRDEFRSSYDSVVLGEHRSSKDPYGSVSFDDFAETEAVDVADVVTKLEVVSPEQESFIDCDGHVNRLFASAVHDLMRFQEWPMARQITEIHDDRLSYIYVRGIEAANFNEAIIKLIITYHEDMRSPDLGSGCVNRMLESTIADLRRLGKLDPTVGVHPLRRLFTLWVEEAKVSELKLMPAWLVDDYVETTKEPSEH